MKKALKIAAVVVLLLLVLIAGGGFLLPRTWRVSRSVAISAAPGAIHAHVADLRRWPEWCPFDKEDPAMAITYSGPESGVGAARAWKSAKVGNGTQWITASDPATGIRYELTIEGLPTFLGSISFEADGPVTRVTWTDRGDNGNNPLLRWTGLAMEPFMGPAFERGLADLEAVVTE